MVKFAFCILMNRAFMNTPPIDWFRRCTPYINAHQGKTFVIMFDGDALTSDNFDKLIHDFVLLHSLGIRLVLVYGARTQINQALKNANINSIFYQDVRVTAKDSMEHILSVVGKTRLQIEAEFCKGLANTPMLGTKVSTISGNFITAKPFGVRDGVDYQLTGEVRRIDAGAIKHNLDCRHVVILDSLGFSVSGEIFNLQSYEIAIKTAIALKADKLIFLGQTDGIFDNGVLIREMTVDAAQNFLQKHPKNTVLKNAIIACQEGIKRVHLLSYKQDGAILEELFTTDGQGTLISQNQFDNIREATSDDILGIMTLIKPLEQKGILIERSRQRLEEEIDFFVVIERDGKIIGCAALYPLDDISGEIASIAIDPDYQNGQRGSDLLTFIQNRAKTFGLTQLFALTTRTLHWFIEHGFNQTTPNALPKKRLQQYHNGRNSKVLIKSLSD